MVTYVSTGILNSPFVCVPMFGNQAALVLVNADMGLGYQIRGGSTKILKT